MKVSLKTITPDAEINILEIARASSTKKDKTEPGLINYLVKNRHWSPFEHSFVTWEIETSKAIGIQLLRHRSNYFQEFSQRYQDVNKLDDGNIFELYSARKQATDNRQSSTKEVAELQWSPTLGYWFAFYPHATGAERDALEITAEAYNLSEKAYNLQLQAGISRETARFILPMATRTRLYVTQNIRSLVHWLDLRDDGHAQLEAQLIAQEVKRLTIEHLPIISKARGYV